MLLEAVLTCQAVLMEFQSELLGLNIPTDRQINSSIDCLLCMRREEISSCKRLQLQHAASNASRAACKIITIEASQPYVDVAGYILG